MIRFDQGNRRFNYRVVGVAIHNDSVLLHRADHEPFWTLPGGRAEHGETAEQTIKREMFEELTTDVHVDRLLWVVENFFEYEGWSSEAFDGAEADLPLRFKWFPVRRETLVALPLLPAFLPQALTELPRSAVHVVHRDAVPPPASSV